jgi:hypothetical protein
MRGALTTTGSQPTIGRALCPNAVIENWHTRYIPFKLTAQAATC